jgi:predicted ArsR family transcriptional regulator
VPRNTPDPRREYQRKRILAAIESEPMTAQQLADRLFMSRDGIQLHLNAMKAEKPRLAHVSGFQPGRARPMPMYSPGDKKDAVYTKKRTPKRHLLVSEREATILKAIKEQPMTAGQLAEKLGLCVSYMRRYTARLHAEKKIHAADWLPNLHGGTRAAKYAIGDRPDAPKPEPLTAKQKNERRWATLKADPQRHGIYLQMRRVRKTPQTWFSALIQPKRGDNRLQSV